MQLGRVILIVLCSYRKVAGSLATPSLLTILCYTMLSYAKCIWLEFKEPGFQHNVIVKDTFVKMLCFHCVGFYLISLASAFLTIFWLNKFEINSSSCFNYIYFYAFIVHINKSKHAVRLLAVAIPMQLSTFFLLNINLNSAHFWPHTRKPLYPSVRLITTDSDLLCLNSDSNIQQ